MYLLQRTTTASADIKRCGYLDVLEELRQIAQDGRGKDFAVSTNVDNRREYLGDSFQQVQTLRFVGFHGLE
jgi:hypothetical protein